MSFFIADAYAAAPAAAEPSAFANIAMLVVFMLVFYFLLWRPQAKRQKEHKALMDIQKGDEVVFAGGLLGRKSSVMK
jgi:preprotein translocase subunit YajC